MDAHFPKPQPTEDQTADDGRQTAADHPPSARRPRPDLIVALLLFALFTLAGVVIAATVIDGGLGNATAAEPPDAAPFADKFASEFAPSGGSFKMGDAAPDFSLQNLDGETVRLSQFRGQPVLINFWATWCGPCRVEMPEIATAYQKYRAASFVVLALDVEEPPEDVRAFVDELKLPFTPLLDPAGEVFKLYQVRALPTSYFVDGEGRVSAIHLGPMTGEQITGYIEGLLARP